ncbi:protein spdB [Streptomyces sp. CAI-85]|uniref:protein spdB n=1 Tax=Streptomyces sp. CAI-85 TaxID=1472662 RepID=UPI001587ED6A|nr:protein spdB [Streptomyces sp. CAI-85]NUV65002.1 MFS transporter [Streptomyces sp. CAI-85]
MRKFLSSTGPAVAMTAVSMALTLAVVVLWLGGPMPWGIALVVGIGLDGGWLATLAYERRLAAQGDRSTPVAVIGWAFGLVATGVLVAHALTEETGTAAWLAVSWLPLAAKALWLVHGLWERTALTPKALREIQSIHQTARDQAAVARARLAAQAKTEETRLVAVTTAGARVAKVQAATAQRLAGAWTALSDAHDDESTDNALTCVTSRVTPPSHPSVTGVTPPWELPVWGPVETLELPPAAVDADDQAEEQPLTDDDLDALVAAIRHSETPPLSYREMATRFRAAGHSASEVRLRSSWRRVMAPAQTG